MYMNYFVVLSLDYNAAVSASHRSSVNCIPALNRLVTAENVCRCRGIAGYLYNDWAVS